jgi:hypothetical protein
LEIGRSHRVPNQGSTVGGKDGHFVFRQKLLGEDESGRRVKQRGLFSPKFGATSSHVFTQSPQNVAVELEIHSLVWWDKFFVLPQLLYRWRHQSGIFWIFLRTILNADGLLGLLGEMFWSSDVIHCHGAHGL